MALNGDELARLERPCACGHPIDNHGTLLRWDENCDCERTLMGLLAERGDEIARVRVEAAADELADLALALASESADNWHALTAAIVSRCEGIVRTRGARQDDGERSGQ